MDVRNELLSLYEIERKRLLEFNQDSSGDFLHPVFGEGALPPIVMFVGEAPGGEEAVAGRPFVGRAGKQLDELLLCAGISRDEAYITNAVKYRPVKYKSKRPSNRTPTSTEVNAALPLLRSEIELLKPRIIATLGNTPLRAMMDIFDIKESLTIGKAHGRIIVMCINSREYLLFPLYHPASVIYNRTLADVLKADLMKLGEICKTFMCEKGNEYV